MSETPTPSLLQDWLREKARVPYFAAYRGDLLSIAHALDSLHSALTAERAARERAEAERDALREDAERYRCVRANPAMLLHLSNQEFDAAVDAARKERT